MNVADVKLTIFNYDILSCKARIETVVRCTQSDFLMHVKRWMLNPFELIHKCTLIQPLFLFSTLTECSRGRGLCTF